MQGSEGDAGQIHVLVVDDDEALLRLLRLDLVLAGYRVSEARTLDAAIAAVRVELPDVAIVDVRLQGESGLRFVRYLRATFGGGIRIVVTSAYPSPGSVGSELFLAKPFTMDGLEELLEQLLRQESPVWDGHGSDQLS